jgi:SAM-dependent methyltransferase
MPEARYDAVADFYEAGWLDRYDDPVSVALFDLLGPLAGRRVLDVACGHGRITRELARHGARPLGLDLSRSLIAKAETAERADPLGIEYVVADIGRAPMLEAAHFDLVVCSFGLSDIDDLEAALRTIARTLRPAGRFVFSILHPCFPGAGEVSGSWSPTGGYYDERWWRAGGSFSSLRRRVGANHRMLSTYLNALCRHGLRVAAVAEPRPPAEWTGIRDDAARFPVFLVVQCVRPEPSVGQLRR